MGQIKGQWIETRQKQEILALIETAKDKGVSVVRSCTILAINRRRIVRWQCRVRRGLSLEDGKPGPCRVLHSLLPTERQQVVEFAQKEEYVDLSHRILTVTAWEQNLFFVSFSTVYRILCSEGMMSQRGPCNRRNGRSLPPVRKELTGPNQRWCWDISYLYTFEKGVFLFLYLLLDEFSRKAISWLISWHQNAATAKRMLDNGMIEENILDLPDNERPEIVNDRGRQMKAKSVRRLLKDHSMPQIFARPRTPDDNPFVESAFSTVKCSPNYPGRFRDLQEAREYFFNYFNWYNAEHYHSGIDYVTPLQAHNGLREKIVVQRQRKMELQRQRRKQINRYLLQAMAETGNLSAPCSVIGG